MTGHDPNMSESESNTAVSDDSPKEKQSQEGNIDPIRLGVVCKASPAHIVSYAYKINPQNGTKLQPQQCHSCPGISAAGALQPGEFPKNTGYAEPLIYQKCQQQPCGKDPQGDAKGGLIWSHNISDRIGNEPRRRGVNYSFSAVDFWLWGVLGSFIAIGPLVYLHKLFKAVNKMNEHYNING